MRLLTTLGAAAVLGLGCTHAQEAARTTTRDRMVASDAEAERNIVSVRDGDTMTSVSQGNSPDEINITAAIRRTMVDDGSLSFTAKNVRIVTQGSRVTLRGPVKNATERTTIGEMAIKTSGVTAVDNQIEVEQ